jgi:hypothetical protein
LGSTEVVFVPGAPAALRFATEPSDSTVAGQAFATQPVVEVLDRFENVVVQDSASSIGLALTTGEGALAGTTTITAVGGRGTFAGLRVNRTGADKVLTASATGLTAATTQPFVIVPAAPSAESTAWSADPATDVVADGATAASLSATVRDAFGNLVPDAPLFVAVRSGTASLPAAPDEGRLADANGAYSADLTSTTAGPVEVGLWAGTDSSGTRLGSLSVAFVPGEPTAATSAVRVNPERVDADRTAAATVSVTLYDANRNPVPDHPVTLIADGGSSVIGEGSNGAVSGEDGVVSFAITNTTIFGETITYSASTTTTAGVLSLDSTAVLTFVDVTPPQLIGPDTASVYETYRPVRRWQANEAATWSVRGVPDQLDESALFTIVTEQTPTDTVAELRFVDPPVPAIHRVRLVAVDTAGNEATHDVEVTVRSVPTLTAAVDSLDGARPIYALSRAVEVGVRRLTALSADREVVWSLIDTIGQPGAFTIDSVGVLSLATPAETPGATQQARVLARAGPEGNESVIDLDVSVRAAADATQGGCVATTLSSQQSIVTTGCSVRANATPNDLAFEVLDLDGAPVAPLAGGRMRLLPGGGLALEWSRRRPGTMLRAALLESLGQHTPLAAALEPDLAGVARGTIPLPAGLAPGRRTLLVWSTDADDEIETFARGVLVDGASPDAPSAPTNVAGDGWIDLFWAPPEFDGGAELTGWQASSRLDGGDWAAPFELEAAPDSAAIGGFTARVDSLQNLLTYEFRVRGVNRFGPGVWSEPSEPVTAIATPTPPWTDGFEPPEPGQTGALVNGTPVEVESTVKTDAISVTIPTTPFGGDTGEPLSLGFGGSVDGGVLEFPTDGSLPFEADGLPPGGGGQVVMFSEPLLVGTLDVNWRGEVESEFALPEGLEPGEHTLAVQLVSADGAEMWVTLGVRVRPGSGGSGLPADAPATPTGLAVMPLDAGLELEWDGPVETHGHALNGFRIDSWPIDGSSWTTHELTLETLGSTDDGRWTTRLEGLDNGRDYRVRIAAVSERGAGAFSEWSTTHRPGAALLQTAIELVEGEAVLGTTIVLEVRVTNVGATRGERVWVVEGLAPDGLAVSEWLPDVGEVVETDEGDVLWRIGDLDPGDSAELRLRAIVLEPEIQELER